MLLEGELPRSSRKEFDLGAAATVQALKLEVLSNWGDLPQTHLSEFEAVGAQAAGAQANPSAIDGLYAHEYGPIVLRRDGNKVTGCYINGTGVLNGLIDGRVIRLGYLETASHRLGSVVWVAAHDQLFGFWFGPLDTMGSPWNAPKVSDLTGDLGGCAYLAPQAASAQTTNADSGR